MKALVYTATMQTEFRDMPDPVAEPGQVIVDLAFCGICGSDMHAWHGLDERRVPPLVLGHEAVGVVRNGPLAQKRVAINPLMTCGDCQSCRTGSEHLCSERELIGMRVPGAFAEAVAVSEQNLYPLPDTLSFDNAALAEPLAVAVHAVKLGMEARKTNAAIVLGGGAIGLLCARVLEVLDVPQISIAETNPLRRELLSEVTGARAYDPISGSPGLDEVDLVIDCVGSGRTRQAASHLARPGGIIVHVGLQDNEPGLDTRRLTLQEITFLGTYCYTNADFADALKLLAEGKVTRDGWTELRPLSRGGSGFEDIHNQQAVPKIILEI